MPNKRLKESKDKRIGYNILPNSKNNHLRNPHRKTEVKLLKGHLVMATTNSQWLK